VTVFLVADLAATQIMPTVDQKEKSDMIKDVIRTVIGFAIWSMYLLRSVRVRSTFTTRYADSSTTAQPAIAPAISP
jgi:hypothetical protein